VYAPLAATLARRATEALSHSALPTAPVRPPAAAPAAHRPVAVLVRRGLADVLRRSADRLAPVS